jgi:uncharacterized integral membrane protein
MALLLRILAWAGRILLFALLFLVAAKNTDPVTVRFLFDAAWQAPLALVVLAALALGAALGLLACLPALARQRREIVGLRRELAVTERPAPAPQPAPPPLDVAAHP